MCLLTGDELNTEEPSVEPKEDGTEDEKISNRTKSKPIKKTQIKTNSKYSGK